jgi:hypothetical protein
MDSINDDLSPIYREEIDRPGSPSLLGGLFRTSSSNSIEKQTSQRHLYTLERRVQRLESQTNRPSFNGTLFGTFVVVCVFDYLSRR